MKHKFKDCVAGDRFMVDLIDPETNLGVYSRKPVEELIRKYNGERMTIEAFEQRCFERQNTPVTWVKSDKDNFDYALGCLPPAAYSGSGFLVGEPCDHCAKTGQPRFTAWKKDGEECFYSSRPVTLAEFKKGI
jgi:hypothetical protein